MQWWVAAARTHHVVVAQVADNPAEAWVCVDPCPFYPEGGGQAGDVGTLAVTRRLGDVLVESELAVVDCVRPYAGGIAARVVADESILKDLGGATLVDLLAEGTEVCGCALCVPAWPR